MRHRFLHPDGRARCAILAASLVVTAMTFAPQSTADQPTSEPAAPREVPTSVAEARSRARILHELIHGTLQVVHRDFFDAENTHAIPSRSLEDVFAEMERSFGIEIHWLGVSEEPLNIDHKPRNAFETQAAAVLKKGEAMYDAVSDNKLQYAGAITLKSECLKCHVPRRKTLEDRTAGIVITMPIDPAGR